MPTDAKRRLEQRVITAAEAALAQQHFVSAIDVLVGIGWLQPAHVEDWRRGRIPFLERVVQANLSKISDAMKIFRRWAREQGLTPRESSYVAGTRNRHPLQFSKTGKPAIEKAYRTHWMSRELSDDTRERLAVRASRPPDLLVISPLKEFTCHTCGGTGSFLIMEDAGGCA